VLSKILDGVLRVQQNLSARSSRLQHGMLIMALGDCLPSKGARAGRIENALLCLDSQDHGDSKNLASVSTLQKEGCQSKKDFWNRTRGTGHPRPNPPLLLNPMRVNTLNPPSHVSYLFSPTVQTLRGNKELNTVFKANLRPHVLAACNGGCTGYVGYTRSNSSGPAERTQRRA
jgi:hypothetical protein